MRSGNPADGGHGMDPMAMDPAAELRKLCAAPPPFDLAFIDLMILHQQTVIGMAGLAVERAQHPELSSLGEEMVDIARGKIDQMAAWRTAWFGAGATPSPVSSM